MTQEQKQGDVLPAPYGLLRLSFNSMREFQAYNLAHRNLLDQVWLWHQTLGNRDSSFELPGICDLCEDLTNFAAVPRADEKSARFVHGVEWRMIPCGCGLTSVERAAFRTLLDHDQPHERKVYLVGYHSGFRPWLSRRLPYLQVSQYEEGRRPGETEDGIRYEDLTRLSFRSAEFDVIICLEILEHIPDYRTALREMARVLKPGGRALLTFPWLGENNYEHSIRAELTPEGSIRHLQPPEYHDDPAQPGTGILSFRNFGWRILDEMREEGFADATAHFLFGPVHGYFTLQSPVISGVR